MTADTIDRTDPKTSVLSVLRKFERPLTLDEILEHYEGETLSKSKLRALLKEEVDNSLHLGSPGKNGTKRYWDRNEIELARHLILDFVDGQPRTRNEIIEHLATELKTGSSECWRKAVVTELVDEKRLWIHPRTGKQRSDRLGNQITNWRPYTAKLEKELSVTCRKLERGGVDVAEFLRSLLESISPSVPSDGATVEESSSDPHHLGLTEVVELILRGMEDLDPFAAQGAVVSIPKLRQLLPREYQSESYFDRAIFALHEQDRLNLHSHDFAGMLTEDEKAQLVKDKQGNYYVGISKRR